MPRLARLGVVASVQPLHATDDIATVAQSVGSRARYAWSLQLLLKAGVPLAIGSDCPVADPDRFWSIHAGVTRQRHDGTPEGGRCPGQRLTVGQAVWGFTQGAALGSARQAELGIIAPEIFADLVVLDRDVFAIEQAEIAQTRASLFFSYFMCHAPKFATVTDHNSPERLILFLAAACPCHRKGGASDD